MRARGHGEHLAHVADDELKGREAVEDTGGDEAEGVQGGFGVPAPAGDGEHLAYAFGKTP